MSLKTTQTGSSARNGVCAAAFPPCATRGERVARAAALSAAFAAACWVVFGAVRIGWLAHTPIPVGDQWWNLTRDDNLPRLFAQHNEHRLVLARLLFEIDFRFFGGSSVFNLTCVYAFQAAHAWLLARLAAPAGATAGLLRGAAIAAVLCLMFWGAQIENFASGFQHQFTAVFALATAAFVALVRAAQAAQGAWRWDAAAAAAAALSAASMANGLAAAGLLPVMAFLLGRPRRTLVAFVVLFAVLAAAYLYGYVTPAHHARPLAVLTEIPGRVAVYVCLYLGGPFGVASADGLTALGWATGGEGWRETLSLWFGAVAALGGASVVAAAVSDRGPHRPARLALGFSALFVLATAFVTALGRAGFSPDQALSSRYATPALALWAILAISVAARPQAGKLAAAVLTVLCLAPAVSQTAFVDQALQLGRLRAAGAAAALTGATDWGTLVHILPYRGYDPGEIARARAARLGVYAEPWTETYGRPATVLGPETGVCAGAAVAVVAVDAPEGPVWRLEGEGRAAPTGDGLKGVAAVGDDGRIIGFGLVKSGGWTAYARSPTAHTAQAYGVTTGGVCRFDPPLPLPRLLPPAGSRPPGRVTASAPPLTQGDAWAPGAISPAAPPPPWPFAVLGSWVGGDAAVGRATLIVEIGAARRFAMPLITGPVATGQRVRATSPTDGRTLAALEAPGDASTTWRLWRFALPDDWRGDKIAVTVEDAGAGWGQWLAVGPLHVDDER